MRSGGRRSDVPDPARPGSGPPGVVRAAGALVASEGVLGAGFAGYLLVRAGSGALGLGPVLGEAGMFLLAGAALLAVGGGLLRGRWWARTPAIVVQLLLLPAVYSLLGPSRQVVAGVVAGVVVIAALLLLLGEPARVWSMDSEEVRRRER